MSSHSSLFARIREQPDCSDALQMVMMMGVSTSAYFTNHAGAGSRGECLEEFSRNDVCALIAYVCVF